MSTQTQAIEINAEVVNDKAPAIIPAPATPANKVLVTSKAGKVTGEKYFFGKVSATDLKALYKSQNPTKSGKQISAMVNESLQSEAGMRRIMAHSMVGYLGEQGFVPDVTTIGKNASTMRFVKSETPASSSELAAKAEVAAKDKELKEMNQKMDSIMAFMKAQGLELPA